MENFRKIILCLTLCFSPLFAASTQEINALSALYDSTNGATWTNSQNWKQGDPCTNNWHGVSCIGGYVYSLWLSNNNLTGTIPSEIGNLTSLTSLWLSGNNLTGTIPSEIGDLTSLTYLSLWNNNLTGTIPVTLKKLTNLTNLYLINNYNLATLDQQLINFIDAKSGSSNKYINILNSNKIIQGLKDLYDNTGGNYSWLISTNWKQGHPCINNWYGVECDGLDVVGINLSYNNLAGIIPSSLGQTQTLQKIILNKNNLSGAIPKELGSLKNLKILDLSHNKLSGFIPKEFNGLNRLETFDISNNNIIGSLPQGFENLTHLNSNGLILYKNCDIGTKTQALKNLLNAKGVSLDSSKSPYDYLIGENTYQCSEYKRNKAPLVKLYNSTNGKNWHNNTNWLGGYPCFDGWYGVVCDTNRNIIRLNLNDNNLAGKIPDEIGNLGDYLQILELENNHLTGSIPKKITSLFGLSVLRLENNNLSGKIPDELQFMGNLRYLELYKNCNLTTDNQNLINYINSKISFGDNTMKIYEYIQATNSNKCGINMSPIYYLLLN